MVKISYNALKIIEGPPKNIKGPPKVLDMRADPVGNIAQPVFLATEMASDQFLDRTVGVEDRLRFRPERFLNNEYDHKAESAVGLPLQYHYKF